MAKFCPLYSSSSGNCTYIAGSEGAVLVDAGVSCRKIVTALESIGADPGRIGAILLTHEHIDHIRGLKVLTKQRKIPVYATGEVLGYLTESDLVSPGTELVEVTEEPFVAGGMLMRAFSTPHDSVGSVGYRIETPDEHRIAVATDLGHVTQAVEEGIEGCDLVLLESNYDEGMLRCGPYPYYLKRRIAAQNGHLSNLSCAGLAQRLIGKGTTRFTLAHLSRENNFPQLAFETISQALKEAGFQAGLDFELKVAPSEFDGGLVRL